MLGKEFLHGNVIQVWYSKEDAEILIKYAEYKQRRNPERETDKGKQKTGRV